MLTEAMYRRKIKNDLYILTQQYIEVRHGKYGVREWFDKAMPLIEECIALDPAEPLFGLIKSHAYLLISKKDEANKILFTVEKYNEELFQFSQFEYAYYLYLQCISNKKNILLLDKVNGVLSHLSISNPKDWRIQWFRLQLEDKYRKDIRERYRVIKKSYKEGCRSSIMYLETCQIFIEQPEIISDIQEFEIQVLNWGTKYNFINKELAIHISTIIDQYDPIIFKTLKSLYKIFNHVLLLKSICLILINSNRTDQEAFEWYQLGLNCNVEILDLKKYYLNSISKQDISLLSPNVIQEFMNCNELTDESQAYLYASILMNRKVMGQYLPSFINKMISFAERQIKSGNIDKWLAIIFEQLLLMQAIPDAYIPTVINHIFTSEIICENKNIKSVIISHREIIKDITVPIKDSKAIVPIFTNNYTLIFVDNKDRRYIKNIKYKINIYFKNKNFLEKYYIKGYKSDALILYLSELKIKDKKIDDITINIFNELLQLSGITDVFKKNVLSILIHYYYEINDLQSLSKALTKVNIKYMAEKERIKIVEYLITLGFNKEALKAIEEYGYENISTRKILALCSQLIQQGTDSNSVLLEICYYLFKARQYNEVILGFLAQNCMYSLEETYEIWKECKYYSIEAFNLEEKIIKQVIYTETFNEQQIEVFISYYNKHKNAPIVRNFLSFLSSQYMLNDIELPEIIFDIIRHQTDIKINNLLFEYTLFKWYSIKISLTSEEVEWIEKFMYKALYEKRILPWFKNFYNYIVLPQHIKDKVCIDYITENNKISVFINYRYQWDDNYHREKMNCIGMGIHISLFLLFHNEELQYYIEEVNENGERFICESENLVCRTINTNKDNSLYELINSTVISKDNDDDINLEYSMNRLNEYYNDAYKYFKVI